MKKKTKENISNGITLIALVVTIVVLLILAGVSISMLTGEQGIIKQAQEAKEKTEIEEEKEKVNLAAAAAKGNNNWKEITRSKLKEELDKNIGVDKYELTGEGPFTVKYIETGRSYPVETYENKSERYYGDSSIIPTDTKYFTFVLNEENKTASITGIKDKYVEKGYYTDSSGKKESFNSSIIDAGIRITDVIIPFEIENKGTKYIITEISDNLFGSLRAGTSLTTTDIKWTSIIIPNSIIKIGDYAFAGCFKLKDIIIPRSVTTIGKGVFAGWTASQTINFEITEAEKPSGWGVSWNYLNYAQMRWGATI